MKHKEGENARPDIRLNIVCFLAPTLSFVLLVFLSIVIFNFATRGAYFAINMWPFLIAIFYLVVAIPFAAMCAFIEMSSVVATTRRKAAAKGFLLGLVMLAILMAAAWFLVFRQAFTTR